MFAVLCLHVTADQIWMLSSLIFGAVLTMVLQQKKALKEEPAVHILTDEETWQALPKAEEGTGQPLPVWARAVAVHMPRTAAAMLVLDHLHRTHNVISQILRAKMRWVIADTNRCEYSKRYALADLRRTGATENDILALTTGPDAWPESDRQALEFAYRMTTAAPEIPDELFECLRQAHGDRQVAAMVNLAAYGNFQDRIVLGLNLPMEETGPLPPVKVQFPESVFQRNQVLPKSSNVQELLPNGEDIVADDAEWGKISYDELQTRLERQKSRKSRLPIPTWDDVKYNLPASMQSHPTSIHWSLVNYCYAPELAVAWSTATRTMWSEMPGDRVLEESLFWIQTRAIECNYCMGHCEMLLEVAGLNRSAVTERTSKLAGNDWSAFSPVEQRAYAYARKLTKTPWELTVADYRSLEHDFGPAQAMSTFWWLCRGLYMTRISDGFQFPLERDNVFANIPVAK